MERSELVGYQVRRGECETEEEEEIRWKKEEWMVVGREIRYDFLM